MRNVPEVEKLRKKMRGDKIVTRAQLDKINQLIEFEEKNGINTWKLPYNGNRLTKINAYLYDTDLVPQERVCFNYKAKQNYARGIVKGIREEIIIEFVATTEKSGYYTAKLNGRYLSNTNTAGGINRYKRQHEVLEDIKHYIEEKRIS